MQLSIIIINYKSAQLVIDCLQSILNQNSNFIYEVIVVDNDSNDGSIEKIKKAFPGVRYLEMSYNAGFARANNEAIKSSDGEIVLLLNADTIIRDNAIEKCYNEFINSAYIACGVQLLNPDGSPQISGNYAMKGGLNYLLPLPFLGNALKFTGSVFKVKKPNVPRATGIVEVDWINGAFLMVRRSAIEVAGLMDEDFFLYAEETEWCSRLRKAGRLCIYGDINAIHLQGETINFTFGTKDKGYYNLYDKKGLQIMLSNLVRIRKEFGVGWFLCILLIYCIEVPFFFLCVLLLKTFFVKTYSFSQVKNYAKNIFKILKLTATIIRNKPHFYKVL